jgi:hypothetical protein
MDTISSWTSCRHSRNRVVKSNSDLADPSRPIHTISGASHDLNRHHGCWTVYLWIGVLSIICCTSGSPVLSRTGRSSDRSYPLGNYNCTILLKPWVRGIPCIWTGSREGCILRCGLHELSISTESWPSGTLLRCDYAGDILLFNQCVIPACLEMASLWLRCRT